MMHLKSNQVVTNERFHSPLELNNGGSGLVTRLCPTLVTPCMVDCQVPLSVGFSRQEYWSGFPFPSLGDLPDPEIEPGSPLLQADTLPTELRGKPTEMSLCIHPLMDT